jgi:hypothetical protein
MTRQHFKISRASEYFDPSELVKRTGQEQENWTHPFVQGINGQCPGYHGWR